MDDYQLEALHRIEDAFLDTARDTLSPDLARDILSCAEAKVPMVALDQDLCIEVLVLAGRVRHANARAAAAEARAAEVRREAAANLERFKTCETRLHNADAEVRRLHEEISKLLAEKVTP